MKTETGEILILGSGAVTPFAAGSASKVLSQSAPLTNRLDGLFHSIPVDFLARYPQFSVELKDDRASWITAAALTHAIEEAGVELANYPPDRIALVLGSAFAGQLGMIAFAEEVRAQSARFVSPIHFPQTVGNYVAGAMSRFFRIHGPNMTIARGEASGLAAVAAACSLLAGGSADIAVAGGFDILSDTLVRGFRASANESDDHAPLSEGACVHLLSARPHDTPAGKTARIVGWQPSASNVNGGATFRVADRVGQSFAAESAMRLCAALSGGSSTAERTIFQPDDDGAMVSITFKT